MSSEKESSVMSGENISFHQARDVVILQRIHKIHREIKSEEDIDLEKIKDACEAMTSYTLSVIGDKYAGYSKDGLYVEREDVQRIISTFLSRDKDCLALKGKSGSGKTNILCHIPKSYEKEIKAGDMSVLLLSGTDPRILKKGIGGAISSYITGKENHLENIFSICGEGEHELLILLDAINETENHQLMKKYLREFIHTVKNDPNANVKICLSSRIYPWDEHFFDLPITESELVSNFTREEAELAWDKYSKAYNIEGTPSEEALERCRRPIMLRVFSEFYQGKDLTSKSELQEIKLWMKFYKKKVCRTREMRSNFEAIVELIHDTGERSTDVDRLIRYLREEKNIQKPESKIRPFLEDDTILTTSGGLLATETVSFTYETFLEFALARYIIKERGWKDRRPEKIEEGYEDFLYSDCPLKGGVTVFLRELLGVMGKEVDLEFDESIAKGERVKKVVDTEVKGKKATMDRCPECGNFISKDNRLLRCKRCQGYFCDICESWIHKVEEYRGEKVRTRGLLCEGCYTAEVEEQKEEIDEKIRKEKVEKERKKLLKRVEELEKKGWEVDELEGKIKKSIEEGKSSLAWYKDRITKLKEIRDRYDSLDHEKYGVNAAGLDKEVRDPQSDFEELENKISELAERVEEEKLRKKLLERAEELERDGWLVGELKNCINKDVEEGTSSLGWYEDRISTLTEIKDRYDSLEYEKYGMDASELDKELRDPRSDFEELVRKIDEVAEEVKEKKEKEQERKVLYGLTTTENAEEKQRMWARKVDTPIDWKNSIGMKFKLIPAGEFMMGSEEWDWSKPVHKVRITEPFYIGIYPVTQREWKAVMGNNPSGFKGKNRPVEKVSWDDCQEFIKKLDAREEGRKYRLPTEAEWEYACRAGSQGKYCFGDKESKLKEYAWYSKNSGGKTHPVGKKKSNRFGLYDVHGNVWEWCQDWYDKGYYKSSPEVDPKGPSDGSIRVYRGGGWRYDAGFCSSAVRYLFSPGSRNS